MHDRSHHADKATGIGDPQCFIGEAGPAKFKTGDRVRVKNYNDVFYTRTQWYARGVEGVVVKAVYESPAAEDEAWDNTDHPMWFYSIVFKQSDLWPEYPSAYSKDTLETELPEFWLESA